MDAMERVNFNYECGERIKACFIGAGRHPYNNLLPMLRYLPVDLAAICDVNAERAEGAARVFGAKHFYADYREMLEKEKPQAVFIITSFYPDGRVQATDIAKYALEAGVHVWMEKPTSTYVHEVEELMEASQRNNRIVMTGMKKAFTPTIRKTKQIMETPEFGRAASIYVKYPETMPPFEEHGDLKKMFHVLDHVYHFGATLLYLMGDIDHMRYEWEPINGGSVTSIVFTSGAVGTLHMAAGVSGSSPLERYEVIGEGANIVVDNAIRLMYYRPSPRPEYGRATSFLLENDYAPLFWEPEFSLGGLYNGSLCLAGYAQEMLHFCDCVLHDKQPEIGTLEMSRQIARMFEGYVRHRPGELINIVK